MGEKRWARLVLSLQNRGTAKTDIRNLNAVDLQLRPKSEIVFGPETLKEMTNIQQKWKEEERINLGSCMNQLSTLAEVKAQAVTSGYFPYGAISRSQIKSFQ